MKKILIAILAFCTVLMAAGCGNKGTNTTSSVADTSVISETEGTTAGDITSTTETEGTTSDDSASTTETEGTTSSDASLLDAMRATLTDNGTDAILTMPMKNCSAAATYSFDESGKLMGATVFITPYEGATLEDIKENLSDPDTVLEEVDGGYIYAMSEDEVASYGTDHDTAIANMQTAIDMYNAFAGMANSMVSSSNDEKSSLSSDSWTIKPIRKSISVYETTTDEDGTFHLAPVDKPGVEIHFKKLIESTPDENEELDVSVSIDGNPVEDFHITSWTTRVGIRDLTGSFEMPNEFETLTVTFDGATTTYHYAEISVED